MFLPVVQWEILGELALRLQHKEEAKEAFQRCLETKFSAKALIKLLEMYAKEGDLQRTLNTAVRLTTYNHRYVPLLFLEKRIYRYDFCQVVHGGILPFHGRPLSISTRPSAWACQDPIHFVEHGESGSSLDITDE